MTAGQPSHGPLLAAGAVGGFVAGLAMGTLLERTWVGWTFRHDPDREEPFGQLRGESLSVLADDGTRLYIEVETPRRFRSGTGPTIIFTHGYAMNQDCWHYQRRDLRDLGRLVFWDQRGHGRSGHGGAHSHTLDQIGRDLATIIDEVAPSGPVILVGHSMGGMTVMSLARQRPELFADRVVAVALLATSPGGINTVPLGFPEQVAPVVHLAGSLAAQALVKRQPLVDRTRSRTSDLGILITKLYSFGGWSSPSHTRFVADMVNATPIDVIASFLAALQAHDEVASLPVLSGMPVLIMVGSKDLMTLVEHSRRMAQILPAATLVVLPDTGHMVITERHAEVNHYLRELVDDVDG